MRLQSSDGAAVELSIKGYQFGSSDVPRDWDANWLVVAGVVVLPDGTTWSFEDPCLTTCEALELFDWLRQVHAGNVQPSIWDSDEEQLLVFTEPNIAFSLAARSEDSVTIRVHLSLESGPTLEDGELFDYFVPIELTSKALVVAVGDWETALRGFPVR